MNEEPEIWRKEFGYTFCCLKSRNLWLIQLHTPHSTLQTVYKRSVDVLT